MKRFLKYIISFTIVVFVVLQFIQPEKNDKEILSKHIFQNEQIPKEVKEIISSSCLDCHSNKTNYLWYDRISPVSWLVNQHITNGKKELNFSEWSEQDTFDKFGAFQDIQEEVEKKNMPLKSYTTVHKNARLSDDDRKILIKWCKKRIDELTEELKK